MGTTTIVTQEKEGNEALTNIELSAKHNFPIRWMLCRMMGIPGSIGG